MPKDAVTLRDVATAAGVHPGTASRALNDGTRALVRPETAARVSAAAIELGYKPNLLARSFKTRRTNSAGIVIPDINNPLFPPMVRGVEDTLFENGYVALLANTESDPARQRRIFESMVDRRVDGLVLATALRDDPGLAMLEDRGCPIVLINRVVEGGRFSSVSVDDAAGERLAVEHLRSLGHQRIAHLAGPQAMSTGLSRYGGFVAAMRETGEPVDPRAVVFAESFSIGEGERCARALFGRHDLPRPTAVVAANDMLALGCYSVFGDLGIHCPGDVSIVGFNDMPFIDRLDPPLSTIRFPHYDVGAKAADLLLRRFLDHDAPVEAVRLPPQLVVRGSTAPPAGASPGAPPRAT